LIAVFQVDQKRRRLEQAQARLEEEERLRAERRERNVKVLAREDEESARRKKRAFEALQKKAPVKVDLQNAEAGMEKTSLFDFGEDDELIEKEELRPVESDDDSDGSDDSGGEVKIFRFPDVAELDE
jgi:hypothetical protein